MSREISSRLVMVEVTTATGHTHNRSRRGREPGLPFRSNRDPLRPPADIATAADHPEELNLRGPCPWRGGFHSISHRVSWFDEVDT